MEPTPRLIRTPRDAEEVACEWLRHWGLADAMVTPLGADEGIDVHGHEFVAQVKAEAKPTGRPLLQALAGVASTESKRAIFFSLGGFTEQAVEWAGRARVALFTFDLSGIPAPVNELATELAGRTAFDAQGTYTFTTRPEADRLRGPWAQPVPRQDLYAAPLLPGDPVDPRRLAVTLKTYGLDRAEVPAGHYRGLWTSTHRYLWSAELGLPNDEGWVEAEVSVWHLCLPEWRPGKLPTPLPEYMSTYDTSVEPEDFSYMDWLSEEELSELRRDSLTHDEVVASQMAATLGYEGYWEGVVVQMASDIVSVLKTLGHPVESTQLEVRDFSQELMDIQGSP